MNNKINRRIKVLRSVKYFSINSWLLPHWSEERFCLERWSRLALVGRVDVLQVLLEEA